MPEDARFFFSCRCGRTTTRSFFQPPACFGCFHCGTNLTIGGYLSVHRIPHEYYNEELVLTEDGALVATVEVCKWCSRVDDRLTRSAVIV